MPDTRRKFLAIICIVCSTFGIVLFFNAQRYNVNQVHVPAAYKDPINVIIVSYPRSGSSLLGELLSSVPNCSSFFEPLAYYCMQLKKCDQYNSYMENLLNCDGNTIKDLSTYKVMPLIKKVNGFNRVNNMTGEEVSRNCKIDSIHVVKTIRLRMLNVIQLIRNGNISNLKIVHLMRDPRARYSSLRRGNFIDKYLNIDAMCEEMESDLLLAQHLPDDVSTRIRYEDLVRNPSKEINAVFNKLYRRNYGSETEEYLRTHMARTGNSTTNYYTNNLRFYYKTNRTMGVDLNQWKTTLPEEKIKEIQQKCNYILKAMRY